jgi:hypothetical protein
MIQMLFVKRSYAVLSTKDTFLWLFMQPRPDTWNKDNRCIYVRKQGELQLASRSASLTINPCVYTSGIFVLKIIR